MLCIIYNMGGACGIRFSSVCILYIYRRSGGFGNSISNSICALRAAHCNSKSHGDLCVGSGKHLLYDAGCERERL